MKRYFIDSKNYVFENIMVMGYTPKTLKSHIKSRITSTFLYVINGKYTYTMKNEMFDVILAICNDKQGCPFKGLTTKDIEIKPNQRAYENVINSTQSYSTLRSSGMCDEEALKITNLGPDPIGVAAKNKLAKQQEFEQKLEETRQMQEITAKNEMNSNNSGANKE